MLTNQLCCLRRFGPILAAALCCVAPVQSAGATLPAGTLLFIRLDTAVSTETSHFHAPITARVVREVAVKDGVVIPLAAEVTGNISKLIPSSSPTDRARMQLTFDHLLIS